MGAKASTPKTPDYTGAALQQGQMDQQIAAQLTQANRPNQYDPYGQTIWTQAENPDLAGAQAKLDDYNRQVAANPNWAPDLIAKDRGTFQSAVDAAKANGKWTQTTSYTPAQQQLLEQQQGLQGTQNDLISQLLAKYQGGNTPQLAATAAYKPANQNDIADQMYQQLTRGYDRRFAQDEQSQRAQLANQGFQTGSEAFNNAMNEFFNSKNQAYGSAANQSQLAGYNQMNQENSQNLNAFIAQHGANLSDYTTQMNYLSQLLGGVQGPAANQPSYPGFSPATQYQAPDLLGAMQGQYQGNLNKSNASNAASGSNMQTLGTLGSIAAMAAFSSDSRLKSDIQYLGDVNGIRTYKWTWNELGNSIGLYGPSHGVLADEVMHSHPHAVSLKNGYLAVDYNQLGVNHG